MRKKTDLIVLHCSATPPDMEVNAKDIDRWHRQRGWLMIGYHFVIKRDGVVESGRKLDAAGAHVAGFNHRSLGVCLVGGIKDNKTKEPQNNFTGLQWAALRALLVELMGLFPGVKVVGHYELDSKKSCPSFDVREYVSREFPSTERESDMGAEAVCKTV